MSPLRRTLTLLLTLAAALAASAAPAWAHATLIGSSPTAGGRLAKGPGRVVLRFDEAVEIVNRTDITVVDAKQRQIDLGLARTAPTDARQVIVPLRGPLLADSYTVRYRVVSDDSHAEDAAFVFATGNAKLGAPILAGSGGMSDTSPVAIVARVAELVGLGLLLGLLAFRMLVWGPAVAAAGGIPERERERALRGGQRAFWRAFWSVAAVAGVAETVVLAAKSAVVFHTGLDNVALHPAAAYRFVAVSRFGDLLGWRSAALSALVAVAFVAWANERDAAAVAGRRGPLLAMAALGVVALTLLSGQGHAAQAPLAPLSVLADAAHLGAAAIWVGGLPCLAFVLLRAPKLLPESGRAIATGAFVRFSRIAVWSVAIISVTGLARMAGELSAPSQVWSTDYGRSLIMKGALLCPILVLALRHRRLVASLAGGAPMPTAARLREAARTVQMELTLAVGIIAVAALLVAQVPGRG